MTRSYRLTPEGLERKRARMKALHADPAFKAKTRARMKALNADPAFKAKTRARMKALNADPAFNPLAGLTDHQKKIYRKLISCGIEQARALAEARKCGAEAA